jgi:hypothetical protein
VNGDVPGRHRRTAADDLLDQVAHGVQGDAKPGQRPDGEAVAIPDEAEQEVLGADVVVVEAPGFVLRQDDHPPCPAGESFELGCGLGGSVAAG